MHKQKLTVLIIAIIGMLCTFMPWINAPIVGAINGTQGDGWITLALFSIPAILCLINDQASPLKRGSIYLVAAIGGLIAIIAIYKMIDFTAGMAEIGKDNPFAEILDNSISIGFGLYILVLAGIALPIAVFSISHTNHVKENITP